MNLKSERDADSREVCIKDDARQQLIGTCRSGIRPYKATPDLLDQENDRDNIFGCIDVCPPVLRRCSSERGRETFRRASAPRSTFSAASDEGSVKEVICEICCLMSILVTAHLPGE